MELKIALAIVMIGGLHSRAAAEDCNSVLQYGIWETQDTTISNVDSQEFANWACNAKAQSSQRGTDLEVTDYGSLKDKSSNSSSSSDCSKSDGKIYISNNYKQKIKTAAPAIAAAWQKCIAALGSNISILYGKDPSQFTLYVKRSVDDGAPKANVLISFDPKSNIDCELPVNSLSSTGLKFENSRTILCSRKDSSKSISISANFSPGGGRALFIPAYIPPPPPIKRSTLIVNAADFTNGQNVAVASGEVSSYGAGTVILNAPPYSSRPNMAEWTINTNGGGKYRLLVEYAAAEPRPVTIYVNGMVWVNSALNQQTGCWTPDCQIWKDVGLLNLKNGENTIRFQRGDVFPHIRSLKFIPE